MYEILKKMKKIDLELCIIKMAIDMKEIIEME